ncbi:MAG: hypothetical protein KJO77_10595 [Bacteroidia bacterium]|nr:hypothetical protein [Bacteroidia bacterium]NND51966.1 hypothetical protein [Flavobacteriaceae bacterium]
MKKTVILLSLLIIVLSCKESKKTDAEVPVENNPKESIENVIVDQTDLNNKLRIYIDGVIKNDIQPKLIFRDDFGEQSVLANKITGRPKMKQRLTFILPEYNIPNEFEIVFDAECAIDLEKIVLNINDDRIIIQDSALVEYFHLDSKSILIAANDTISSSESLNARIINRYSKYK